MADVDVNVAHAGIGHDAAGLVVGDQPAHDIALAAAGIEVDGLAGGFGSEVLVLLGFSGRGDKDLAALVRFDDVEPWDSAR